MAELKKYKFVIYRHRDRKIVEEYVREFRDDRAAENHRYLNTSPQVGCLVMEIEKHVCATT